MAAAAAAAKAAGEADNEWSISEFCEVVMSEGADVHRNDVNNHDGLTVENNTHTTIVLNSIGGDLNSYCCSMCDKTFATAKLLNLHRRIHKTDRPYSCQFCFKSFRQKGHLEDHIRIHTGERPYACTYCDRTFKQRGDLNIHLRNHTGDNPYVCQYCEKSFSRKSSLNMHVLTHTGEKPFTCDICNKSFSQRSRLVSHMDTHLGEVPRDIAGFMNNLHANTNSVVVKPPTPNGLPNASSKGRCFVIGLPDGTFVETHDLNEYFATAPEPTSNSSKDDEMDPEEEEEEVTYTCRQCDSSYSLKSQLDAHVQTHLAAKHFLCDFCNKTFTQGTIFKRHVATHGAQKMFICQYCQKGFAQKKYLKMHLRTHPGEDQPFTCDSCDKLFKTQDELTTHQEEHADLKPYSCTYCQKGFKQKQSLKNHLLSHTGKTNICPYCRAMIKNDEEFATHVAKHTVDLPFVCHFCQKAFRKRPNLNMHLRTHTGEKPYKCKFCSKAFRLQPNLKCHLRVHTGEKPYVCNFCGKGFAQQTAWKSHVQLHTGKKYECGYCCMAFAVRAHLKNHILMYHSNQQPYMCSLCCERYDSEKQLLDHWEVKILLGNFGKVGCGLYQLFMSVLDRTIVTAIGLQDRFLEDVLMDFINASGQSNGEVVSSGSNTNLKRLSNITERFIDVILKASGTKVNNFDFRKLPLQKTIFEMLLIMKNKVGMKQK